MSETVVREGHEFASSEKVLSFLGTDKCRIVYRLSRKKNLQRHGERSAVRAAGSSLFLLDYCRNKDYPVVREYPEGPEYKSFAPMLSPDGSKIVYNHTFMATDIQLLAVEGGTPVKIAEGANPHWCKDEASGKLYVVYRDKNAKFFNVPQDGTTFRLEIGSNNRPVGEPEIVSAYGFGGGMSTNGRYLCTGHTFLIGMDRHTGAISAPLGTVYCGPERTNQTCCPSIAPDGTGRMMALRWPHDRFSVMGWDGSDVKHYPLPEGIGEWQTPEWSTHPDFATGSLMNSEMVYDIVMVNLKDTKYLQVTSDGGYIHAHLWVG